MNLQKITKSNFDPNVAGNPEKIFGVDTDYASSSIILIPVPWEATASYGTGTVSGPAAIKKASYQLDLFDCDLQSVGIPNPWEFGIHMLEEDTKIVKLNSLARKSASEIIDIGGIENNPNLKSNLVKVNNYSEQLNNLVYESTKKACMQNKIVGIIGGEHSVSLGAISAISEKYPNLGILHIDAHADLRNAYEGFTYSHASIMYNVIEKIPGVSKLVPVAIRDLCEFEFNYIKENKKISTYFAPKIFADLFAGISWQAICSAIIQELPEYVYVSFDIDGLDPSLCPNTGTPVPGGLSFAQAAYLLKQLALAGKKIVGFDVTEVAPSPINPAKNGNTPAVNAAMEFDANIGARILYKLCGCAVLSHATNNLV